MKVSMMKLADLKRPEKNCRIHTDRQLKEFKRSVEMFGQIRPIVVDETNTILCGNGLYEALLEMGKTEASVLKRTDLTEAQKKKLIRWAQTIWKSSMNGSGSWAMSISPDTMKSCWKPSWQRHRRSMSW